jgi:hypothetical protein
MESKALASSSHARAGLTGTLDFEGRLTRADIWAAVSIGLAALLIYASALRLGFLSDDFLILSEIQRVGGLRDWPWYFHRGFYDYYRPLVFLSQALDWRLWGLAAAGFHFTNIGLHALNAALVFLLARKLAARVPSAAAAMVFALHPANQETVFWVAGRFDLLSTTWLLMALLALWMTRGWSLWLAATPFGLALLCKESALTFLVVSAARDAVLRGAGWRRTSARLVPFLVVTLTYAFLRSQAQLSPVGGLHRSGKALMLASALAGLLLAARSSLLFRSRGGTGVEMSPVRRTGPRAALVSMVASLGLLLAAMLVPAVGQRLGPTVGFATYAAYLLGPLGLLSEPAFLNPNRFAYVLVGIVGVTGMLGLTVQLRYWLVARPRLLFALVFIVSALVPVSAMPGHTHLYLSTVGVSLVVALALEAGGRPRVAIAALFIAVCWVNQAIAATQWRRASNMTREAIDLVASPGRSCARNVVFLTAPSGIGGIPCNINYEAFAVGRGCHVPDFKVLLRIVREDASVVVTRPADGQIELRFPEYRGNVMASHDLRDFVVQVRLGESATLDTALGWLRMWADNRDQVFRLDVNDAVRRADLFYYSDGHVYHVPER